MYLDHPAITRSGSLPWGQSLLLIGFLLFFTSQAQEKPSLPSRVWTTARTRQLIVDTLKHEDPSIRSQALDALRQIGDPETIKDIRPLLQDPVASIRVDAITALNFFLSPPEKVSLLSALCTDSSADVASQALKLLATIPGTAAYAALLEVDTAVRPELTHAWIRALAQRREVPDNDLVSRLLTRLLKSPNRRSQSGAATLLSQHPMALSRTVRLELLSHSHPAVRSSAIHSFKESCSNSEIRNAVIPGLSDRSAHVRRITLETLMGEPVAEELITPLLSDFSVPVRNTAITFIALGQNDKKIDILLHALSDSEKLVARNASDHLADLSDPQVIAQLITLLNSPKDQLVIESTYILGAIQHRPAIKQLSTLLNHASSYVHAAVYDALGKIGETSIVPLLLTHAKKERWPARESLNQTLGILKDERAIDHLLSDMHYPDTRSMGIDPSNFMGASAPYPPPYPKNDTAVATAAVKALGQIGSQRAVRPVMILAADVLRNDAFWSSIAQTLGQLDNPEAAPALELIAVEGTIVQGTREAVIPAHARTQALVAIERLHLTELTSQILETLPSRCPLEVRQTAAEVLTALTGESYRARTPIRIGDLFLRDTLSTPDDLAELTLKICYKEEPISDP